MCIGCNGTLLGDHGVPEGDRILPLKIVYYYSYRFSVGWKKIMENTKTLMTNSAGGSPRRSSRATEQISALSNS